MDERTRLIRSATRRSEGRRMVNPPIERGSTVLIPNAADLRDETPGPTYGITGTAVHRDLRAGLAELEAADDVFLVSSGLAAVTTAILAVVEAGDEVLLTDAVYGPTRRFCERALKRYGVSARYFPPHASAEDVIALAGERTRLIVLETPGSCTFEMQDVPAVAAAARERGVLTLVDNTFAAGLLFKPLANGTDISIQALTKYVGGHSDLFMGAIAVRGEALTRRLANFIQDTGAYVPPEDAYSALRGLRTLAVRMVQHGASAIEVATWLEGRPGVARVLSPALASHPDHALWRRDFTGTCGLFGVVLSPGTRQDAEAMLDALTLFGLGFSWGGYESLATYEDPQLPNRRFPPTYEGPLIRLHIGLEAPADLIADLDQALGVYARRTGLA